MKQILHKKLSNTVDSKRLNLLHTNMGDKLIFLYKCSYSELSLENSNDNHESKIQSKHELSTLSKGYLKH